MNRRFDVRKVGGGYILSIYMVRSDGFISGIPSEYVATKVEDLWKIIASELESLSSGSPGSGTDR